MQRAPSITMKHLVYLPRGYDRQKAWPLVLFLHGAGERGEDPKLVEKEGLPRLVAAGEQLPFIIVAPQCAEGARWESYELSLLLDVIEAKHRVDPDRVYVTGLSMGGFGTWALAARTPERFAALVPICGGGDPKTARHIAHIPTWVFHGARDDVVPSAYSEEMVAALRKHGSGVKLTVYPDAGHDSWTATYANPELYRWLLEQKRLPKPKRRRSPTGSGAA
jgi:predicted peptidase